MRNFKCNLIFFLVFISIKINAQVDYVSIQVKSSYTAGWGTQHTKLVSMIPSYTPVTDGTDDFTRYGTNKYLRTDSTGFFYVKKIDGRWWMIDPNGYAGINMAVTSFSSSNVQNDYDLVKNLGFNGTGNFLSSDSQTNTNYNPYNYNLFSYTRKLNFFAQYKNVRYTSNYYPNTPTAVQGSVDHITVFDPKFVTFCDGIAKGTALTAANERDLLGYFTDNEINFNTDQLQNLVKDLPAGDPSRDSALVYATSKGLVLTDITTPTSKLTDAIKQGFATLLATKYYKIVSDAVHKYDTNHLLLGSRLHGTPRAISGVVKAAEKYMDVTSVNFYDKYAPSDQITTTGWTNDKPCLVTEFYIKDANVFSTAQSGAGWYVNSQTMRGNWYQNTCLDLLKSKCYIGWQYFRFEDDTDSNKGIVNSAGNEYTDMTAFMKELNKQVYHVCEFYDGKSRRPAAVSKTKTFSASQDAYIIPGTTSTTNYGTVAELEVRNNAREANIREAFFKFDLTSVKDSLKYLKHAQLDLYCTQSDATVRSIFASGLVDNNWQELTITGALRNANNEWKNSNNRLGSQKAVIAVGNLSYDVTTWIYDQKNSGMFSFKIQDLALTNSSIKIASREYSDSKMRPKLTISYYDIKSTDIKSVEKDAEFRIYPNPATSKIFIEGDNLLDIKILNLSGQTIYNCNSKEIDLSNFISGIYFVNIKTLDGRIIVRKLVKN